MDEQHAKTNNEQPKVSEHIDQLEPSKPDGVKSPLKNKPLVISACLVVVILLIFAGLSVFSAEGSYTDNPDEATAIIDVARMY